MSALAHYPGVVLPTAEEEIWRYSRIEELSLDSYVAGTVDNRVDAPADVAGIVTQGAAVGECGVAMPVPVDAFAEINAIHCSGAHSDIITVKTERGRSYASPVVITRTLSVSGVLAAPRLVIDAAENSEITVVEHFLSSDDISSLIAPVVEIRAAQSARVTYVAINELGRSTWLIGYQRASADRDATVSASTVALGGDYSRVRAGVRLVGKGASAKQVALYFADGNQMHDFRTLQDHAAPRTHSDLLFKGAVRDTAKSVYTGLIKIRENADKSEAFQTNRSLTLSSGAWAESVPNLEIETNDVKCSHASTVGPIDDDQRFYLESRGIRPEIAERLVVFGFFADVIDRLPAAAQPDALRDKVGIKLLGVDFVPTKIGAKV